MTAILVAELRGNDTASIGDIVVTGRAPALALCRKLVELGYDPSIPLHVYRDGTLAIRVASIGAGAKLTVDESTGCRFAKWKAPPTPESASPVRLNADPLPGSRSAPARPAHEPPPHRIRQAVHIPPLVRDSGRGPAAVKERCVAVRPS
jgi:hypothetical protein